MSNTKLKKKKKGKIHGYKGDSRIQVRQRLPKSVVNCIIKATPSLQSSRGASVSKNSSFIDNFFNSRSKQETFRIGRRQSSWLAPGMQHVKMEIDNKNNETSANNNNNNNRSILSKDKIDSDMFGLKLIKRNRYQNKSKSSKWRLKNKKKHNEFIKQCIEKEKQTLTINKVLPLHKLWCKYANDVMIANKCTSNNETKRRLLKVNRTQFNASVSELDLHGCLIKIIQCKSRRFYVDYEGIVVLVSKNRFCIITSLPNKNKLICIPFKGTVFTFELCQRLITIYGDHYRQFIP